MTKKSPDRSKRIRQRPEFIDSLIDTIKINGNLFTVFAVILIGVSGITIVDNPSNWWVSALSVLVFFVIVFMFMNAIVLIKIAGASLITLFLSSYAFKLGSYIDPYGTGGLVWMCSTLFLFFSSLSFSYLVSSGKSRWGVMMITQMFSFIATYIFSIGFENVNIGVLLGLIIGALTFVLIYKFSRASRFPKNGMPINTITEEIANSVYNGAREAGMQAILIENSKPNTGSFLVWRNRAYLLHPVLMESAFVPIGRRAVKLGYREKNINPWLINLAFTESPLWKSRGANIMPILVDLNNRNGASPKVIGVSLPDTKNKLPVGVIPGKIFKNGSEADLQKALEALEDEFTDFVRPLTEKQSKAMMRIGKTYDIEED